MIETVGDLCDFISAAMAEIGYESESHPNWRLVNRETSIQQAFDLKTSFWSSLWGPKSYREALYKATQLAYTSLNYPLSVCFGCWEYNIEHISNQRNCNHMEVYV